MTEKQWDFQCPQFIDFCDPQIWQNNDNENDAFFAVKHSDRKKKLEELRKREKRLTTIPVAPKLHAIKRNRVSNVLSTEQREKLIMDANNQQPFKATPLNKKIFESKYAGGLPKVASVKSCVKPIEFRFRTEERLQQRKRKLFGSTGSMNTESSNNENENKPYVFKATPFNAKLFENKPLPKIVPSKQPVRPLAKPFNFQTDARIKARQIKMASTAHNGDTHDK